MTKEQLRYYRDSRAELAELRNHIEEVNTRMYSARSPNYTGVGGGGGNTDPLLENIALKDKLERILKDREHDLLEMDVQFEQEVVKLSQPNYIRVIRFRYQNGYSFERIADLMQYEIRHIFRLHDSALQEMRKMK